MKELIFGNKKTSFPDKYFVGFLSKNQSRMIDPEEGTVRSPKEKVIAIDERSENFIITMNFPDGTEGQFSVPRNELVVGNL